jgi:L-ascorbate metabolism protein UlaG (beta-lactamase superfamily)
MNPTIRYFGWSALAIETAQGSLFFDPFYRKYCGAEWYALEDFSSARVICATHGHEEHYLDIPEVARRSGATVVGHGSLCSYLGWRSGIARDKLVAIGEFETRELPGFTISAFKWKHRDINLYKALTKAVFQGNSTQLSWAWSSATRAPFYSPYMGYHVTLPGGLTVLNYNEGFNTKMTDAEINDLGQRYRTDVLLAGMQLDFVADVARGAAALKPKIVVLYPPHDYFHRMMGATSRPWAEFKAAVEKALPAARVVIAEPGMSMDAVSGAVTQYPVSVKAA